MALLQLSKPQLKQTAVKDAKHGVEIQTLLLNCFGLERETVISLPYQIRNRTPATVCNTSEKVERQSQSQSRQDRDEDYICQRKG